MKLSEAVANRIRYYLKEKHMTQYRLEKLTAIPHNTMKTLMSGRYKGVNLRTVILITKGLGITTQEFFSDPVFDGDDLEID